MAYREIRVVEVREVLRQWLLGEGYRAMARRGLADRKTVRRYVEAARELGLRRENGVDQLDDQLLAGVVSLVKGGRPSGAHGEAWTICHREREWLQSKLGARLRLTKIHELLTRRVGPEVPYRTLHRFVQQELGFGGRRTTVRVDDCAPGAELQIDFGRMGTIVDPDSGRRRVVHALIFTAVYSRHMFVWLTYRQTFEAIVEGCEQAWQYFGGVFKVVIPDNMKAIVAKADPVSPKLTEGFFDYAQARGFIVDPTRIKDPTGKARVERSVPFVRESFFRGEEFRDLAEANQRAETWCRERAGRRLHGTTHRRPVEVFEMEARDKLLPSPKAPYDIPRFVDVKVHRDQHITVGRALYSIPENYVGEKVHVRSDSTLVRIYHQRQLIKTHPRMPVGGRSTDDKDFQADKMIYARRDVKSLRKLAEQIGSAVEQYASRLLDGPAPWQKMRAVYRLLGLARRYGDQVLNDACSRALELDVIDIVRIERIVKQALEKKPSLEHKRVFTDNVIQLRFARPKSHFALTDTEGPK